MITEQVPERENHRVLCGMCGWVHIGIQTSSHESNDSDTCFNCGVGNKYLVSDEGDSAPLGATIQAIKISADFPTSEAIMANRYRELANCWQFETAYHSSPTMILGHKNYGVLKELGSEILPYLVFSLKYDPDIGSIILFHEITKLEFKKSLAGKVRAMAEHAVKWAQKNNIKVIEAPCFDKRKPI